MYTYGGASMECRSLYSRSPPTCNVKNENLAHFSTSASSSLFKKIGNCGMQHGRRLDVDVADGYFFIEPTIKYVFIGTAFFFSRINLVYVS